MLLEIKNLSVTFPTRRGTVEAASNVSLTVRLASDRRSGDGAAEKRSATSASAADFAARFV